MLLFVVLDVRDLYNLDLNTKYDTTVIIYNKLYWKIKPKRHECKRDSKSHARHSTFLHTIYKLLLLNR